MLILQRRVGERIVLGGGIEITVTEVTKGGVRLAVHAPRGVTVVRGEVHDAIVAANSRAMESEDQLMEAEVFPAKGGTE
ncbi:MAG: carbon storage regulator [Polyangiaceae bacterium]|jgi:carbon storage regulator